MAIADRHGLPIALGLDSAAPSEVTRVEDTLDQRFTLCEPKRLIGDKAFDSDALDKRLRRERGIEFIAPHRSNRRLLTQDGRPMRRYRRRWRVERLFAWLQNFRRLVVRYEYYPQNFLGMLLLGAIVILSRHL